MTQRDRFVSEQEIGATITAVLHGDDSAWAALPVPVRLLAAALTLAGSGKRVSKLSLAQVGRTTRSAFSRPQSAWKPLVDALVHDPGALHTFLLTEDTRPANTVAQLQDQLAAAEARIAELRTRVAELETVTGPLAEVANAALDKLAEVRGRDREALADILTFPRPT